MLLSDKTIRIAARDSALSKAQVEEVLQEIRLFYPHVQFDPFYTKTYGDKDLTTSLRKMGKTDFFTKEVDDLILNETCRVAIHSAKDLPEKMPDGLVIAALTKGQDPSDSLVLREKETLDSLPYQACIGVSCSRREEAIKHIRQDLICKDIRGVIHHRLFLIEKGIYDGVVVAEAALIRLKLVHLNRIKLDSKVAPFQGRLAIVVRENDWEMKTLFAAIHYENTMSWT